MHSLPTLLQFAETISREAGKVLARRPKTYDNINAEPPDDVKLQADVETENIVRQHLAQSSSLPIIGEEHGGDASLIAGKELFWIVDPLDGTYNYLRQIPLCCVSIGLFRGLEPVLGVIYDFNRDELFSAIVEQGDLLLNGEPCQPKWEKQIERAIFTTGFPSSADLARLGSERFARRLEAFKKVRMIGSAALALAHVAVGRYDLYQEERIYLWDIAAGMALVNAAGGTCQLTPRPNDPLAYTLWAGADSALWEALMNRAPLKTR